MIVIMIAMSVMLSFVDYCGVFRLVNAFYEA